MKKFALPVCIFVLVASLLVSNFNVASAAAKNLPDPRVTPVSGDSEFTVTIIPIASLPGSVETGKSKIYPVGYESGDKEFGGSGVSVTGLASGIANACFSLDGVGSGWGGQVAMWNGSQWVFLPTTISRGDESRYSNACADITANGTYVLIKWIADASLLPSAGACNYAVEIFPFTTPITSDTGTFDGFVFYSKSMHEGMVVTMQTLYVIPDGSLEVTGIGSGVTVEIGPDLYRVTFDTPMPYIFHNYSSTEWAISTTIDDCSRVLKWPDDYR